MMRATPPRRSAWPVPTCLQHRPDLAASHGNKTVDHQKRTSAARTGIMCRNETVLSPRGRGRCVTPTSTTDLPAIRARVNSSALIKKPSVAIGSTPSQSRRNSFIAQSQSRSARAQQQLDQTIVYFGVEDAVPRVLPIKAVATGDVTIVQEHG